jgi:hypothetical protein
MSDTLITSFSVGEIKLVPYGKKPIRLTTEDTATVNYDFATSSASLVVKTPTSSRTYKLRKVEK